MRDISLKDLLEAGCHFGHKAARWYPKAAEYIFAQREGVHIIDLIKTKARLEDAGKYLFELGKSGGTIVFVGAKRQAKLVIEEAAKRSGSYFLTQRWPGGFLTNFPVMKKNLDRIKEMEVRTQDDKTFTKKERLLAKREMEKLLVLYGGVQGLEKAPDAIFVVDIRKFAGAVREATSIGVKLVAITDTNVDPEPVNYPIPANDDAVGSIKIIVDYLADCYLEGKSKQEAHDVN
ncbi:MAG: 30S ribosomal protein S2 [bacterium]|nr:30S ribosomal protein S2 [bacterium]